MPPGWPRDRKEAKPPATRSCPPGRPGERCAGFERFEVVLAGRSRIAEVDERRVALPIRRRRAAGNEVGSSPPRARATGWRSSVGSRSAVAKPCDRWRARGSPGVRRALVDGRRLGPGKPSALTCRWWKRSWFLEDDVGSKARRVRRGATGGVRGFFRRSRSRSITPWRDGDPAIVGHPAPLLPVL